MLYGAMGYNLANYWRPTSSTASGHRSFRPYWNMGGAFIDTIALIAGLILMSTSAALRPPFFRGEVLNRNTPSPVPEDIGTPAGLFGVDASP